MEHDWEQDWHYVTIIIPDITSKTKLNIELKSQHIVITYDGAIVITGKTQFPIYPDESTWYLQKNVLYVELTKAQCGAWWSFIVEGVIERKLDPPEQFPHRN